MSKNKKEKIVPIKIATREGMEAAVADVVRFKLQKAELTAQMEQEIADVQKRYQEAILSLDRQIEIGVASTYMFCQDHRAELFAEKKTLETLLAEVGFRTSPPAVEKLKSKDTWGQIALRLQVTDWGKDYIREADPEVNKQALITDRSTLDEAELKKIGITITQEENFFIEPKSQVAERTVKQAA